MTKNEDTAQGFKSNKLESILKIVDREARQRMLEHADEFKSNNMALKLAAEELSRDVSNSEDSKHPPSHTGTSSNLICPFMSKPGATMYNIGLVDTVFCQRELCMAWEPHTPVDEHDTYNGGRCKLIPTS